MSQVPGARSFNWMARGACRQADPELFFPAAAAKRPAARQVEVAKAVCAPCPVRANCLAYAVEARPEGIWGGTTPDERRAARRRPPRGQVYATPLRPARTAVTGNAVAGRPAPPGPSGP